MTPENQRDEEIKIYYDDEYITVTEAISKLTPEEIDRGNHCDQTIIDLISAITSLRQSWEKEKAGLEERVRTLEGAIAFSSSEGFKVEQELTRLKARNEELEGSLDVALKSGEVWKKEALSFKAENEQYWALAKQRQEALESSQKALGEMKLYHHNAKEEISRLSASLAAAREALDKIHKMPESSGCGDEQRIAQEALSDPSGSLAFERWKNMKALVNVSKNNLNMLRYFHLDYTGGPTDDEGNRPIQPLYRHHDTEQQIGGRCLTCDDLIAGEKALEAYESRGKQ